MFAVSATFSRRVALTLLAVRLLADEVRCDGPVGGGYRRQLTPASPFTTPYGFYTSNYDHMDVNQLLKNDKLVTAYVKCFLGEAKCTPEGRQVKNFLLPDIISTVCSKCTPRQKVMARQVIRHIYTTRRNDFDRIMAIYDKDNKYGEIIAFMNSSE